MTNEQLVLKGSDQFMNENDGNPVNSDAARDLIERAEKVGDRLFVLALGAPTNVASALLLKPEIKEKIFVVWLGGKGHQWSTAYEFNLKQDIKASQTQRRYGFGFKGCSIESTY